MEDGVEEIQNIVFADKRSLLGGGGAADKEAEQRVEQIRDEAKELGGEKKRLRPGLVNNLISTLLVCGSGGEDEEVHEEKMRSGGERKEEEKESGGLINHIISNLVSPVMSPREVNNKRKAVEFESEVKEEDKGGDKLLNSEEEFGGGGGIITTLISSIFHQDQYQYQDQGGGGEEGKGKDVDQAPEQVKSERGSGRLKSLVSSFPAPLAEDAAPTTEEASILIHSIVHD